MLGPFWLSEAPNSIKIRLGERLGIAIDFGSPFGVQFITCLSMVTESARKCRVEDAAEEQGGGTAQLQCQSGAHKNEGRAQAKAFPRRSPSKDIGDRPFHQEQCQSTSVKPVPNNIMQWK